MYIFIISFQKGENQFIIKMNLINCVITIKQNYCKSIYNELLRWKWIKPAKGAKNLLTLFQNVFSRKTFKDRQGWKCFFRAVYTSIRLITILEGHSGGIVQLLHYPIQKYTNAYIHRCLLPMSEIIAEEQTQCASSQGINFIVISGGRGSQ